MTQPVIVIDTILSPLPRGTRWWGTAHTARRKYEWHAEPDGSSLSIMAEREPGLFVCIRSSQHRRWFRQPVRDAIARMIPLLQAVKRTSEEWLAAAETVGKWEAANPWPKEVNGITEAHWAWRRQRDAVAVECGLQAKLKANAEAVRVARAAGWLQPQEGQHAQAA